MAILKGVPRARIILRHALLNTIGPIVNIIALNLAYLVSGVVIVETVFAYPGLAKLMIDAVYLGHDTLSRTLYGARTTIGISLASTLLAYLVGITLGVAAAVGGTVLDSVLSRINDAFLSIPSIMMALVVIAAIGSTIPILIILTGLIYASTVFRIARSLGLDVVASDFVEAARVRGEGPW